MLEETKAILINEAKMRYHTILPCGRKNSIDECFTYFRGRLILWFNTRENDTHVVQTIINETLDIDSKEESFAVKEF